MGVPRRADLSGGLISRRASRPQQEGLVEMGVKRGERASWRPPLAHPTSARVPIEFQELGPHVRSNTPSGPDGLQDLARPEKTTPKIRINKSET